MNTRRRLASFALVAFGCVGFGAVNTAQASTVTYTQTGGTLTGTLGGVPFSGLTYTMTAEADPASFNSIPYIGSTTAYVQTATTTMTLNGLAPFQITTPSFGPSYIDAGSGFGFGGFSFGDSTALYGVGVVGALSGDVVSGSARAAGNLTVELSAGPLSTTAGVLDITAYDGVATFGPPSPSSVPEIDPAGMGSVLALIGGCVGLLERRRKRA